MESLPGHSWRKALFTGDHHQVPEPMPPADTDTGLVWAACMSGQPPDLWAGESDADGEPRCVHCLVLVGGRATARRARHIAETKSQTPAAFLALDTRGPTVRATSTRLTPPAPESGHPTSEEDQPMRRPEQGDSAIDFGPCGAVTTGDSGTTTEDGEEPSAESEQAPNQ